MHGPMGRGMSAGRGGPNVALDKWAAAVVANGGTVSSTRAGLVRTLIAASMDCGHWSRTDDIALLVAENAGSALTTLKRNALMTVTAAPTFTTDRGYAFNGTTQFIDTRFAPSTMAQAMTAGGDGRISAYERTNVASNTVAAGVVAVGSVLSIRPRGSANGANVGIMSNAINSPSSGITDSRGLTIGSAPATSTATTWKNGSSLATGTITPTGVLPTSSIYIGARNNAGTADQFRASTIGYADFGASLSSAAELAWRTALQAFMAAVGADV